MKNAWKIIKENDKKIIIDIFIADNEGYGNGNHDRLGTISIYKEDLNNSNIQKIVKDDYNYDLEDVNIY